MVSPTRLCWRYHSLPLRQRYVPVLFWSCHRYSDSSLWFVMCTVHFYQPLNRMEVAWPKCLAHLPFFLSNIYRHSLLGLTTSCETLMTDAWAIWPPNSICPFQTCCPDEIPGLKSLRIFLGNLLTFKLPLKQSSIQNVVAPRQFHVAHGKSGLWCCWAWHWYRKVTLLIVSYLCCQENWYLVILSVEPLNGCFLHIMII